MHANEGCSGFVIFELGGERYGLPVGGVSSIIRYEDATPVPRAADSVLGVINLRGRVIPVIDLGARFSGDPFRPGPTSRIVVAEAESGPVGIAVDSASEVVTFSSEEIRPVPEGVLDQRTARAFTGVVERSEGKLVILLDLNHAVPNAQPVVTGEGGGEDV